MSKSRIAIVGAGFSGLGAAIRLKLAGIDDFVVLERRDGLGGTWYTNRYPGCQCDIPSHLYSFSFAPNPGWTRTYSERQEIWEYLSGLASRYGIDAHIRFQHELRSARWDEQERLWRLATSAGDLEAQVLIVCPGPLSEPRRPRIAGIETFEGAIFHSADWIAEEPIAGRRIAVIGTGASAIQLIPRIASSAAELTVYQRTPPWVIPHRDRPTARWERALYGLCPPAQQIPRLAAYLSRELLVPALMRPRAGSLPERLARQHLRAQIPDAELRAKLTPRYRIGCKRILISNDFYPALTQPHVELVSDPIAAITPAGILTADGRERQLDTIILATGFRPTEMPLARRVRGRGAVTLAERWQAGPQAYLGTSVAGFPNMFLLVGPNTGLGHNSLVYMIESQLRYVMGALRQMQDSGADTVEVRQEVQQRYCRSLQERLRGTVWAAGGCDSWYLDRHGEVATIWPGYSWQYRSASRFRPAEHLLT